MITHDYKLIFVHVPKCAGRSICDIFNQRFDHYTARYYEAEYSRFWSEYKHITIVRNPYARLVSLYLYIKNHRRHQFEAIACYGADFKNWLLTNLQNNTRDFDPQNPEGNRGTDGDIGSPFWFTSQWERIIDYSGRANYDLLHKLEDGMKPVSEFLYGIMGKEVIVPHVNVAEKGREDNWKLFYDQEAYDCASSFPPIVKDCFNLGYDLKFM